MSRKAALGLWRWLRGAREIVQLIKCLPYKLEDLNLVLRTHMKMQGCSNTLVMASPQRQRQEEPWSSLVSQSNLIGEFKAANSKKFLKVTPEVVLHFPLHT